MISHEALVVRERRQHEQWRRDVEFLRWLSRFRFVSADVLELRFATSARKCRKRLARLEHAGLVLSDQPHLAAAKLYAIGSRGRTLLGLEQRRPPRWAVQVVHELAIARLVASVETQRPDLAVLSERDCRRRECSGAAHYSVACQLREGALRRWPDIVIEGEARRVAVEIELAAKTSERLKGILLGYLTTRAYDTVQVRCGSPALERRVRGIVERLGGVNVIDVTRA